jgi:Arc/MetJ family transcription regulator
MRSTLNIDDSLLRRAEQLTGVREKTALVRLGLEALIARESSRRLAVLGGTEKRLRSIPRRRSALRRVAG